jgi:hypothetical protein
MSHQERQLCCRKEFSLDRQRNAICVAVRRSKMHDRLNRCHASKPMTIARVSVRSEDYAASGINFA